MSACRIAWVAWVAWTAIAATLAAADAGRTKAPDGRRWASLARDGLHDPRSPAVRQKQLQPPSEALSALPPDSVGNKVRWVQALENGSINPRTNVHPETKVNVLDGDIILSRYGSLKAVRFPHRQHTLWLDCSNCHEKLFVARAGANQMTMFEILQGEWCGRCHGAVAFPLTECGRCHSVAGNGIGPGMPSAISRKQGGGAAK